MNDPIPFSADRVPAPSNPALPSLAMTPSVVPRILVEDPAPGVRLIMFNRPEVRNAFDTAMYLEVADALRAADADDQVGAVVVTGAGTAFTSGQDLAEMAAIATGTAVEGSGQGFIGLLEAVTTMSIPLLAAVNGVAVGLGFTLLAHCDLVLIDKSARLRVPFAELGVPPEAASSVLFPARLGWQQAARLLLTSDWVTADEAVEFGLALQVCDDGEARGEAVALAARIASHPHAAVRAITSLMRDGQRDLVWAANQREQAAFARLLKGAARGGALAEFAAKGRD
jgi:enoyl-CoA hydratase/carnithine racemase